MLPPFKIRLLLVKLYDSGQFGRLIVRLICNIYIFCQKIRGAKPYQDKNPLGLVLHKSKVCFIGMPKAATQSFLKSFYLNEEEQKKYGVELIKQRPVSDHIFRTYPNYFSFTFVRNPWARALSCYNSKISDPHPLKTARIHSLYKNLSHDMSFLDFTRWLLTDEGHDDIADRHWLSQYHFITNENGQIQCNHIGRFENMAEELPTILKKNNIEKSDLTISGYHSGASAYHRFYCDESRDNVTQRYQRDIELFGYKFEE